MMQNLTVYKANEVIEAGYRLSLNEQRVVLACIAQVDSTKALLDTERFELSAKDFAILFSVSDKTAYETLRDVADTLFNRYVVISNPFPDKPKAQYLKTRWISSLVYYPEQGTISLRFAQDMLPYLSGLKRTFTRYKLEHIGKMTSIYAIRLYEFLAQWQSVGKREIELDWLKEQFEITTQYSNMNDFKKRVLTPAIKDINTHSNFNVTWEQRKTGRKVTHLIFTFAEKPPETEKSKRTNAKKEKTVYGVPMSEINKRALAGEKVEDAAARINRENEAKSTPPIPVKPSETATHKPKTEKPSKETDEQKAARVAALKNALKGK
jgi:plasmid replication initiation protein